MTDPTNPTPGKSKSQNQRILEYLQSGKTLSPLQALELFNCWALSSRCADLNKQLTNEGNGHRIDCKLVKMNRRARSMAFIVMYGRLHLRLKSL